MVPFFFLVKGCIQERGGAPKSNKNGLSLMPYETEIRGQINYPWPLPLSAITQYPLVTIAVGIISEN